MDDDSRSPSPRDGADDDHPPPEPGAAAHALSIEVLDPRALLGSAERGELEALTHALAPRLGTPGSVRVRLVDDREMSRTHERTHGDARTTDVISLNLAPEAGPIDADLVVCVDEARRQGAARGHRVAHELVLYIAHGVLHCLGHDDLDDASSRRMHTLEDDLLESIGIGRVFSRPATGGTP